jgi:glucose-6-phosphate dehydrogenase assembly protein OpcA
MADPDTVIAPDPIFTDWTTPVIDTGRVHDEIDHLWDAWVDAKKKANPELAQLGADSELMRPSTLNLIAIAETAKEAEFIEASVRTMTEFPPSRTVILVRGASGRGNSLGVRVSVHEHTLRKGQPAVRFETVTIAAKPGHDGVLASATSPLLVPELPDFLWVRHGELANLEIFTDLLEIADRVIVDTAPLEDPGSAFDFLARLAREPAPAPQVTDLAWARITNWRQLIAQFFDQPASQPCLQTIDSVTVEYGGPDAEGRSGLTAGILTASWLATRLGWRAPGELVPDRNGWRLTLRSGAKRNSREVLLSLRPSKNPEAVGGLATVHLVSADPHPGDFHVERTTSTGITTTSTAPDLPKVSRLVYGRVADEASLLSQELRNFAGDPVYEEALLFAADLWPNKEEG